MQYLIWLGVKFIKKELFLKNEILFSKKIFFDSFFIHKKWLKNICNAELFVKSFLDKFLAFKLITSLWYFPRYNYILKIKFLA